VARRTSWCSPAVAASPAGAAAGVFFRRPWPRAAAAIWLMQVSSPKCIYANYLIIFLMMKKHIIFLFYSILFAYVGIPVIAEIKLMCQMPADACLLLVVSNPNYTKQKP
jgi:hypothetical protein